MTNILAAAATGIVSGTLAAIATVHAMRKRCSCVMRVNPTLPANTPDIFRLARELMKGPKK